LYHRIAIDTSLGVRLWAERVGDAPAPSVMIEPVMRSRAAQPLALEGGDIVVWQNAVASADTLHAFHAELEAMGLQLPQFVRPALGTTPVMVLDAEGIAIARTAAAAHRAIRANIETGIVRRDSGSQWRVTDVRDMPPTTFSWIALPIWPSLTHAPQASVQTVSAKPVLRRQTNAIGAELELGAPRAVAFREGPDNPCVVLAARSLAETIDPTSAGYEPFRMIALMREIAWASRYVRVGAPPFQGWPASDPGEESGENDLAVPLVSTDDLDAVGEHEPSSNWPWPFAAVACYVVIVGIGIRRSRTENTLPVIGRDV